MRSLALVLVVTLVGCVPMPNKGAAYAGNAAWFAASAYTFVHADNRRCDYVSNAPDFWSGLLDTLVVNGGCDAGKQLEMTTAEVVMTLALGGIVRTLVNSYKPPATIKAHRSR